MGFFQPYRPHVFVAMPYGKRKIPAAEGQAEVEVDFDGVYKDLFRPALEQAGCNPFRADEEVKAGDIRTDMFFELATADFVIADISSLNPNVFYELGVRQGVAERGVILVYDGRTRPPFDIAVDRTFKYRGDLFRLPIPDGLRPELEAEVARVAKLARRLIESDPQTQSSPVYKELPGLAPPDVRKIKTASARYFDAAFEGIADRVKVARNEGRAGDILTLADEAPNALYRSKLLYTAGRSVLDLKRFDLAKEVFEEQLKLDPRNLDASSFLGLSLNRLHDPRAEVHVTRLIATANGHADANGALGRIYKDEWRVRWEAEADLERRKENARDHSAVAEQAMNRYGLLFVADPRSYYNGINFLALAELLRHLGVLGEDVSPPPDRVRPLVKTVAEHAYDVSREDDAARDEYIWAAATLGELCLLSGEQKAVEYYRRAATVTGVTHFVLDSMLDQIKMYDALGFAPPLVASVRRVLERELERALQRAPAGKPLVEGGRVLFASGHMIDKPDRASPRFPRDKEEAVQRWIADWLSKWNIGERDVVICGGARGTDLLVAEACLERGARVELYIALDESDFLHQSVDLTGTAWRQRYMAVKGHARTTVRSQPDALGRPPTSADAFSRNNRWMLNTAWVKARDRQNLLVLLVWDGKDTGDGPGGTSHAARIAREFAGDLQIADPMKL